MPRQHPLIQSTLTLLRTGALLAACAGAAMMSGCGLKGPLYLPATGTTPQTPAAASAPTTS
ncbi:MAG: hypothetical protein KAX73_08680 [Aquabacterium sp.]|nr:hypothetical protein [Aquabacterium sp.]